ncbi:flagellar motor protein MotB [Azospirillum sp. SYSU D00513]|uniref:OmpA/MotB family protein n=1 Tax=Azospirillum sp. SYSU D00513 TaxID=2812561 RepID=UPI001A9619E5|nr:flagellar motor protein MotB [Azospirillum sp. SYSU D00513]
MIRLPHNPPGLTRPAKAGLDAEAAPPKSLWLISLTDLISLMLAFFVLMYSMSEPLTAEGSSGLAKVLMSARSTALAPSSAAPEPKAAFNAQAVEADGTIDLDYLHALLRSQTGQDPELSGLSVRREDDRLVIGLPGALMFDAPGGAFSDRGRRVLFLLGAAVGRIGNRIEVVGHAEGEEGADGHAWERSLTRAVAVAAALRETGYRRDLVARSVMAAGTGMGASAGPRVDVVVRDEAEG